MELPEFTPFAEVYTHPYGDDHRAIAGFVPYKSGLTPISTANANTTSDERAKTSAWEIYQLTHLKGESTSC